MLTFKRLKAKLRDTWIFPRYVDRRYMHAAVARAAAQSRGKLLDVGCGMRQYEYIFSGVVRQYVGLDWPRAADQARADVIGDALSMPFMTGAFDAVLVTEVIEHVTDPEVLLSEISRVIRPGGTLTMSAPFIGGLHEEPRDYYRFTPYILRILLARHGFSVDTISPRGGWWTVVLGSFVVQALYDLVNPANQEVSGATGDTPRDYARFRRSNANLIGLAVILPLCAMLQMVAYVLDRLFESQRYTLGYVIVATRNGVSEGVPVAMMAPEIPEPLAMS